MKLNWKSLLALALIVGALVLGFDSLKSRSYAGTNLKFDMGPGPLTVTNPSSNPVNVQLVGTGTRSFSVTGTIKGLANSSVTPADGTGQIFDLTLPPGVSELTVVRGTNVSFVGNADTRLEATAHAMTASQTRNGLIACALVILGSLFYISRMNGHRWIAPLRRRADAKEAARVQTEVDAAQGQGKPARAYGDNRASL